MCDAVLKITLVLVACLTTSTKSEVTHQQSKVNESKMSREQEQKNLAWVQRTTNSKELCSGVKLFVICSGPRFWPCMTHRKGSGVLTKSWHWRKLYWTSGKCCLGWEHPCYLLACTARPGRLTSELLPCIYSPCIFSSMAWDLKSHRPSPLKENMLWRSCCRRCLKLL